MIRGKDLPNDWKIYELHELASKESAYPIGDGDHGQIKPDYYQDSGIPYIRVADLVDDKISLENMVYIPKNIHYENLKSELKPSDIIIAKTGATIGKVALIPKSIPIANTTASIGKITLDTSKMLPKFLLYFLKTKYFTSQMWRVSNKSAQAGFNIKDMKKFNIIIPPIPTQKKITSILEKAEQLKQWRRDSNKLTDDYLNSIFLEMFGDPVKNPKKLEIKKLREIANINMGQSPKGDSYNTKGVGMPLLNGPTEFGIKYPIEKQWTSKPTKMAEKGSILFCVRGATAGRMNWADKEYCVGRGVASINSNSVVSNEYLYLILKGKYSYFQNVGQGSTFINIGKELLSNLLIPIPDEKSIKNFINNAREIGKIKDYQMESKQQINDLFNVLMQKAFRGELVC